MIVVSVCLPSDALSHNTYHLTWVSLTLDVGYLFTADPARCSRCSLPWTRLPLLTLNVEQLLLAVLHPHSHLILNILILNKVSPQKKLFNQSLTYLEKGKYPVPAYSSHPVSLRGGGKEPEMNL